MSDAGERCVDAALAAARASGLAQLVVAGRALAAHEAAFDSTHAFSAARAEERFMLERPCASVALAALGASAVVESDGADRLELASAQLREQAARTHAAPGADARWVGGFAFAHEAPREDGPWRAFGSCRFVLPRALLARDPRGARLAWSTRIEPGDPREVALAALDAARAEAEAWAHAAAHSQPPARSDASPLRLLRPARGYRRLVSEALDAIAKGEIDKLVVARAIDCRGVRAPVAHILRALRATHPRGATFALAPHASFERRGPAFLGTTPELLVRLAGGVVEAQALAGSARRGRSAARDSRARSTLFASAKERAEHEHVVASLRSALAPLCDALSEPAAPRPLAAGDVEHLETRVCGRLAPSAYASALDLAARLHPSPAVAGAPREAAARWLAANEPLERGWYAGAIGWQDARGDGELFVALRCALLRGEHARLYAGAGIVAGSQPAAEQRETRLKLRTVFHALRETSHARG
ncbi:MAG: isochorismate synthase [Deltaproteobacteria bacterium]|nr:isochorismate synthase [Deltaproteobacteria bacterium]